MPLPNEVLLELWRRALRAEKGIGIRISTPEPRLLQVDLYKARQEALEPNLYDLTIQLPGGLQEVWIIRKDVELPSVTEENATRLAPELKDDE